jgi:hypothetical protein
LLFIRIWRGAEISACLATPAIIGLAADRGSCPIRAVPHRSSAADHVAERGAEAQVTDRLSLTNALSNANIDRQAAERIATEIFDAIHDNVATKADLQVVEAALKADLQRVEADLQRVEAALKADLQRVEADLQRVEAALRADLQRVEAALRADLQRIEASLKAELALRLSELEHRMTVRFGSVMVVLTGIVLAAIRYLPHS